MPVRKLLVYGLRSLFWGGLLWSEFALLEWFVGWTVVMANRTGPAVVSKLARTSRICALLPPAVVHKVSVFVNA